MNDSVIPAARAELGKYTATVDAAPCAANRLSSVRWLVLVALAAALLCAPFFRALYFLGDEGTVLHEADLILLGKKIYADFFQFLPPGGVVFTAAWFSIAGVSFGSARVLAVLTIVGTTCFTFLACQRASKNVPLSAFFSIAWVMMSVWPWMQISHHWFATLLSMAAAWAAFVSLEQQEQRLRWPLIAGGASGAAAICVPHSGTLTMLAAMTAFLNLRHNRTATIAYVLGCALAPVGALAYLLALNTLAPAYDDIVRFTTTRYLSINLVRWALGFSPLNHPLKYVFQLTAILTLVDCAYDWRASLFDNRFRLCAAFALAGFLSCYPRPDIIHISYCVPLALPLLALCATRLSQSWRSAYRYAAAGLMIALCLPSANAYQRAARVAHGGDVMSTPRGDVALVGPFTSRRGLPELLAAIAGTQSGDAYLFYPYDAMLPFLTAREDVSKYDIFAPGYTTPAQYQEACRSAVQRASWAVVDRLWTDDLHMWKAIFPRTPDPEPQETVRFQRALDSAFEAPNNTGTFELRRRREGVNDSVCDDIAEK